MRYPEHRTRLGLLLSLSCLILFNVGTSQAFFHCPATSVRRGQIVSLRSGFNVDDYDAAQVADYQRRAMLRAGPSFVPTLLSMSVLSPGNAAPTMDQMLSGEFTTASSTPNGEVLTVPLKWIPKLSAYVVYYSIGGERFGAIIDTGSPFLVVPQYCNRQLYGCYQPKNSRPSGYEDTWERFDNNQGQVEWRYGAFSFMNATGSMMGPSEMVFGVLSESLMNGSGGVFLGLIRDTDSWIRPSFLGQTNVCAMDIDLRDDNTNNNQRKTLTLYTQSPFTNDNHNLDYIPMVRDLNRKYGDPVIHYTAKASSFLVNGNPVLSPKDRQPIYVIFDTGVTGMVVSRELMEQRYTAARQNREKSLWGQVQLEFVTRQGGEISVKAQKPVTTPLGEKPWPKFNKAHLIVAGLAFLDGHKLSIDMDQEALRIT